MYKKHFLSLIFSLLTLVLFGQNTGLISIENVSVIPMTSEQVLEHQRVLISDGIILKIESVSTPLSNNVDNIIDGTGKFLIPGLSEMHYHLRSNDIESDFKLFLSNGITTVRNMAEFDEQDHIEIGKKVKLGVLFGPNYFTTGPYLTSKDLETEEQIKKVVQEHKNKGYDFLKLADNLPKNNYLTLLQQSQLYGVTVIGHAQRNLPLEVSTRMKSIEHVEEFLYLKDETTQKSFVEADSNELNQIALTLKNSGLYIGTTLSVFEFINDCLDDERFAAFKEIKLAKYLHRDQRDDFLSEKNDYRKLKNQMFGDQTAKQLFANQFSWMKLFTNILYKNDVKLLTGSDTYGMVIVGFSLHREFELLQEAGMRPYDILVASTINPARYLNTFAMEGTISEGKNANLVLLSKNPLLDIRNTQTIEGVMIKGKWLDRQTLNKMLDEVEIAYK